MFNPNQFQDSMKQNKLQTYQFQESSKEFKNFSEQNNQNLNQIMDKYSFQNEINQKNSKNKQSGILKQIYDNDEQCSITIKKCEQFNYLNGKNKQKAQTELGEIQKQSENNKIMEYEKVELFNNDFTRVTFQYNKEIKRLTIRKYFKENKKQEFKNEITILEKLAHHNITLPLVSYSQNDELWYEQISGQKDFLIIQKFYFEENSCNENSKDQQITCLLGMFSKLFVKLDKMFELGYAHSDIKLQNIVLGFDNEPYFIDFGGSVELNNFNNYLNQFTPLYNHPRYYQKIGNQSYKKYSFSNEEEIKQCDRIQLAISFLYLIINAQKGYYKKHKYTDKINLLNKYLRENDFEEKVKISIALANIKVQTFLEKNFKREQYITTQIVHITQNNIIDILNLIIQTSDHYEKIKNKIQQISNLYIYREEISDFDDNNDIRLNQYNVNLINIYLEQKKNYLRICPQKNDLQFAQYSSEHSFLFNLSKLQQSKKVKNEPNIILKKQNKTGKIIYEIPFIQFNNIKSEYILPQIKKIEELNDQYEKDKSLRNRDEIEKQLRNIIDMFSENKSLNFLQIRKSDLKKQNLEIIIDNIKSYINQISIFFQKNKIIVQILNEDFMSDEFFKEIFSLSNQQIEFELVFINCRFKNDLYITINSFVQRYQRYDISNSLIMDLDNIRSSVECCSSLYDNNIHEISQQTQKEYIRLKFIGTKQFSSNYFSLKQEKNFQTFISPFYSFLFGTQSKSFQQILQSYSRRNNDCEKINFLANMCNDEQNEYLDSITFIINQNAFLNYFFDVLYEDSIISNKKIIDNVVILNISGVEYLIFGCFFNEIAQLLQFKNQNLQISQKVLVISVLNLNNQNPFDILNSEKLNNQKHNMRSLKSLIPYLIIQNNLPQHKNEYYNSLLLMLKQIQYRFKLCEDFNKIFDTYVEQNQSQQFESYENQQSDYDTLLKKFEQIQTDPSCDLWTLETKYLILHHLKQFERIFNPKLNKSSFKDCFDSELKYLHDLIRQNLSGYQPLINGDALRQQLKQHFGIKIQSEDYFNVVDILE